MSSDPYQNAIRIRVNGLLVREESLLLVKILSPVTKEHVWMPPGGGLAFEETMEECLVREFDEETGLQVEVGQLRHLRELISSPYHAVEFYFQVKQLGGELQPGYDPEVGEDDQIIEDLRFIPFHQFVDYSIVPDYVRNRFISDYRSGSDAIRFN